MFDAADNAAAQWFRKHGFQRRACYIAERIGKLDEYYSGHMPTIDMMAQRWQFYTGLYGLPEMQSPVSGESLARIMGLYR